MKIAFVATEVGHQRGGGFMGGTANNVVRVSRELARRGHDITIITTPPRDAADHCFSPISWATIHAVSPTSGHGTPRYLMEFTAFAVRRIHKLHEEGRLDLITIHAGFSIWGVIGSIASHVSCPAIHVQYCPVGAASGRPVYDLIQSPLASKIFLTGVDRFVAISDHVASTLSDIGIADSVEVIHTGIDTDQFAPSGSARQQNGRFVIGYLGSLRRQKGLDVLVEAFESLAGTYPVHLALGLEVRSARSSDPLWTQIDRDPNISVQGMIEDIPAFLNQCDVFVVPFRNTVGPADYPVAALEAMACGVPVVGTRVGGIGQLIDHRASGLLVDPTDADALHDAIKTLIDDPVMGVEYGRKARSKIQSEFSLSTVCDAYERAFRSALAEESHKPLTTP